MTTPRTNQTNGWKTILGRVSYIALAIVAPLIIGMLTWLISEAFINREFRISGARFTQLDGARLQIEMRAMTADELFELRKQIDSLPPEDWRNGRIQMQMRITNVENAQIAMGLNQTRMLVILEQLALVKDVEE